MEMTMPPGGVKLKRSIVSRRKTDSRRVTGMKGEFALGIPEIIGGRVKRVKK
jgi:hypothetical protein